MAESPTSDLLVRVNDCEFCHQSIRVVSDPSSKRELAFDHPSGEIHACWDLPQNLPEADLLILDDDCDC